MTPSVSCCVVLGQALMPCGQPSRTLLERVHTAARFYHSRSHEGGDRCLVLCTGGDPAGVGRPESEAMMGLLVAHGVSACDVLLEKRSRNTMENAFYSLPLLAAVQHALTDPVVHLVSSDFHLPRACYMFEAVFADAAVVRLAAPAFAPLRVVPLPARHGCLDAAAEETKKTSPSSLSAASASSYQNTTSVGAYLDREVHTLKHRLLQEQLPRHIHARGDAPTPVAPLPDARLQRALDAVLLMKEGGGFVRQAEEAAAAAAAAATATATGAAADGPLLLRSSRM